MAFIGTIKLNNASDVVVFFAGKSSTSRIHFQRISVVYTQPLMENPKEHALMMGESSTRGTSHKSIMNIILCLNRTIERKSVYSGRAVNVCNVLLPTSIVEIPDVAERRKPHYILHIPDCDTACFQDTLEFYYNLLPPLEGEEYHFFGMCFIGT